MKIIGIALYTLVLGSSSSVCSAFAPSNRATAKTTTTTTQLHVKSMEGWKVDGLLKPVNNFILIKKAESESESAGGILISKSASVKKTEGSVVSTGPGKAHPDSGILFPMPVSEGDGVIYGKYDGTEITLDGVSHSLIRDDNILVKYSGDTLSLDSVEAVSDGVVVFVETRETETSSGLILSVGGDANERPSTGVVVKVGPGRMAESGELIPMNVVEGDQIKFRDFAGNEVKIGDKEYSVVKMPDILAKF
jgi:chaperonin GroES